MPNVDIVVPVRNEGAALRTVVERIAAVPFPPGTEWRVLFVEDSSTDDTLAVLRRLANENPRVGYYSLERGYGQAPAILFGVAQADGDAVIMMDGDGSHPASALPHMVAKFLEGFDVVQVVRAGLEERPLYRRAGAALFQLTAKMLTGVDLIRQNTYFRLVSRRVAEAIAGCPRYWFSARFPLTPDVAGRVAYLPMAATERGAGVSKYGFLRLARFARDTVLSLISPRRFAVLLVPVLAAGIGAAFAAPLLAAVILGAVAVLAMRYRRIVGNRLDRRIFVKEWAGAPPPRGNPEDENNGPS